MTSGGGQATEATTAFADPIVLVAQDTLGKRSKRHHHRRPPGRRARARRSRRRLPRPTQPGRSRSSLRRTRSGHISGGLFAHGKLLADVGESDETAIPTTTVLASSLTSTTEGDTITLTATVTSAIGTPSGTVTFFAGSTQLGQAPITGGTAVLTVAAPAAGVYPVTAVYPATIRIDRQARRVRSPSRSSARWTEGRKRALRREGLTEARRRPAPTAAATWTPARPTQARRTGLTRVPAAAETRASMPRSAPLPTAGPRVGPATAREPSKGVAAPSRTGAPRRERPQAPAYCSGSPRSGGYCAHESGEKVAAAAAKPCLADPRTGGRCRGMDCAAHPPSLRARRVCDRPSPAVIRRVPLADGDENPMTGRRDLPAGGQLRIHGHLVPFDRNDLRVKVNRPRHRRRPL